MVSDTGSNESPRFIGSNLKYSFRILSSDEDDLLQQALEINNAAFPTSMHLSFDQLRQRATNGFAIGAFDEDDSLCGILTGQFIGERVLWSCQSRAEITGGGTGSTHDAGGNVALLTTAASRTSVGKQEEQSAATTYQPTEPQILDYIATDQDYVWKFHKKPKAGFVEGAKVYRVLLNGEPNDIESLGAVIMYVYPPLSALSTPAFVDDKIGTGLVEASIHYAKSQGREKVVALSRLGQAHEFVPPKTN
jgi:hypothetical protein